MLDARARNDDAYLEDILLEDLATETLANEQALARKDPLRVGPVQGRAPRPLLLPEPPQILQVLRSSRRALHRAQVLESADAH
jgi:hypothetical protein